MEINTGDLVIIIISLVLLGMIYFLFRSHSRSGVPTVQTFQRIDEQIELMLEICDRHGWQISDQESALVLAKGKQFTFDEQDYQTLLSRMRMEEKEMWEAGFLVKQRDGSIDYDRTCARVITMQTDAIPTYLTRTMGDLWIDKIDTDKLHQLEMIANAIKLQWGKELFKNP